MQKQRSVANKPSSQLFSFELFGMTHFVIMNFFRLIGRVKTCAGYHWVTLNKLGTKTDEKTVSTKKVFFWVMKNRMKFVPKQALYVQTTFELKIFLKTVHALLTYQSPENVWKWTEKRRGRTKRQTQAVWSLDCKLQLFLVFSRSLAVSNQSSVKISRKKWNCARFAYLFDRLSKENSEDHPWSEI